MPAAFREHDLRVRFGTMFILVMGVTGAGKTTVGTLLAAALGWPFYDADAFHSEANIAKMASGVPLTDEDRGPWLQSLRALIAGQHARGEHGVLACSALKRSYRRVLSSAGDVAIVYLEADAGLIRDRLGSRRDHYMSSLLVESQFQALEVPEASEAGISLPAEWPPERIVDRIRSRLGV